MQAVVDIGSNSVKFLVAEIRQGRPHLISKRSWITRLGKNLETTGLLDGESVRMTGAALKQMGQEIRKIDPQMPIRAVATSAVRDCKNPEAVQNLVTEHLGCRLEILSGKQEAQLSFQGAASSVLAAFHRDDVVLIDVGGASTEIGFVKPNFIAHSFQAGAVRCHERLGLNQIPVSDSLWAESQQKIAEFFPASILDPILDAGLKNPSFAVGIGGSLLVASRLAGSQECFLDDGEKIGLKTTRTALKTFNNEFRKVPLSERLKFEGVEPGRADILVAGVLAFTHVLDRLNVENVFITEWGLRYGILFESQK
jgi:exopolyphosphatase/guanosine-5'-triphosphate,3'-diphosphate pyrophosphatase